MDEIDILLYLLTVVGKYIHTYAKQKYKNNIPIGIYICMQECATGDIRKMLI